MKPYSLDLRRKIVEAYTNGEGFFRQLAVRFKVSLSMLARLIKKFRDSETIEPLPIGSRFASRLALHHTRIVSYLEESNDLT